MTKSIVNFSFLFSFQEHSSQKAILVFRRIFRSNNPDKNIETDFAVSNVRKLIISSLYGGNGTTPDVPIYILQYINRFDECMCLEV